MRRGRTFQRLSRGGARAALVFSSLALIGVLVVSFASPYFPWGTPVANDERLDALEQVVQISPTMQPPTVTKTCGAIAATAYYVEKGARELALRDLADTSTSAPSPAEVLTWSGSEWEPAPIPPAAFGGDVKGPMGATPGTLPRYADATGKVLTTSGILVDGGDAVSGLSQLSVGMGPAHNARAQLWANTATGGLWVRAGGNPGAAPLLVERGDGAPLLSLDGSGACVGCLTPAYALDVNGDINTKTTYRVGGVLLAIDHLADVDTSTSPPTEGQVLAWNSAMSHWEPRSDVDVTGIDGLSDVDTSTVPPMDGQVLAWNASQSMWVPMSDADITGIDGLADVDTSTTPPTEGQVLAWNSAMAHWEPRSDVDVTGLDGLNDVTLTAPASGHILRYNGAQWVNGVDMFQGTVVGPGSTTDRAIALWDGTSGTLLQNSALLVSVGGSITVPAGQTVDGRDVSADGAILDAHVSDLGNPHSVTKTQVGLGNVPNLLTNLAAVVDPTATDDSGSGYAVGSLWVNVAADSAWVCVDATGGAAVWKRLSDAPTAVFGPVSSTDRAIALWDGTTGTLLQNSLLTVTAGGSISIPASQTVDGRDISVDGAALDAHIASTSNPHSVTKTQVGLGNVPNLLTNLAAVVAPAPTDDSAAGYAVGSPWVDVATDTVYVCADASVGAAVWRQVSNAGTPAVFGAQYATAIADGAQTISTTTFSQRLRLTTPSLTGGATYRIGWSYEVSRNNGVNYEVRVELDDTTTLGLADLPSTGVTISGTVMQSGFTHISPGAGVHTVDVDTLKSSALGTNGSIRRIRLEIWRVS